MFRALQCTIDSLLLQRDDSLDIVDTTTLNDLCLLQTSLLGVKDVVCLINRMGKSSACGWREPAGDGGENLEAETALYYEQALTVSAVSMLYEIPILS
jgi:hypothetical protein